MKHTATPWKLDEDNPNMIMDAQNGIIIDLFPSEQPPEQDKANAQFIVTACNNHEALVDAAQRMIRIFDELSEGADPSMSGHYDEVDQVRELLTKIKNQ
jgi:hypothetical protein